MLFKSEHVFYPTMEANFVVLARFLLNFVNIIEASKSVSSCQLFLLPPGYEPGTLTPRESMFSITPQKLILLYWLDFYFCYYNWFLQISFMLPNFVLSPGFEPGALTPRVSMFPITPWKLIVLKWLDFTKAVLSIILTLNFVPQKLAFNSKP